MGRFVFGSGTKVFLVTVIPGKGMRSKLLIWGPFHHITSAPPSPKGVLDGLAGLSESLNHSHIPKPPNLKAEEFRIVT